ncbi:MAG: hypothetical protein ACREJG_05695 [Candidatus Rokuibacteriota bacterium]
MVKGIASIAIVAGLMLLWTGSARAEHLTVTPDARPSAPSSTTLDLDVRVGGEGFRLGARVLGRQNVYGAWLNGRVRPDGFTLDGRVQDGGTAHNFTLNAEVWEGLMRAAARSLLGL